MHYKYFTRERKEVSYNKAFVDQERSLWPSEKRVSRDEFSPAFFNRQKKKNVKTDETQDEGE